MGRHGIQISQEGISLDRAADYQKVLDDRWPFLDIAVEQEFRLSKISFPSATGYWAEMVVEHNLGYIPAFTYREIAYSETGGIPDSVSFVATKKAVYARALWVSGSPMTRLNIHGLIRVFACDVTRTFVNPVEKITPRARVSAKKYGVKILKPGRSTARMSDQEMSNFSLNTNAKALGVQQTGLYTAGSPSFNIVINHNLGYPPTYFIAEYQSVADFDASTIYDNPIPGEDVIFPMNIELIGQSRATTTTLTITGAQSALVGTFAVLIIKDPVEVAA